MQTVFVRIMTITSCQTTLSLNHKLIRGNIVTRIVLVNKQWSFSRLKSIWLFELRRVRFQCCKRIYHALGRREKWSIFDLSLDNWRQWTVNTTKFLVNLGFIKSWMWGMGIHSCQWHSSNSLLGQLRFWFASSAAYEQQKQGHWWATEEDPMRSLERSAR